MAAGFVRAGCVLVHVCIHSHMSMCTCVFACMHVCLCVYVYVCEAVTCVTNCSMQCVLCVCHTASMYIHVYMCAIGHSGGVGII